MLSDTFFSIFEYRENECYLILFVQYLSIEKFSSTAMV